MIRAIRSRRTALCLALPILFVLACVSVLQACADKAAPNAAPASYDSFQPPIPSRIETDGAEYSCSYIYTGTIETTYLLSGPPGLFSGIREVQMPTFTQEVISSTNTSAAVRIRSVPVLDTSAAFPLDRTALPPEVLQELEPTAFIQSNHPEIVAMSHGVTEGTDLEAQAVSAILEWVSAHIRYDLDNEGNDALTVFRTRKATCAGYSSVSVALLRASGIPARMTGGCAMWVPPSGGGHAWIDVFYPDVGWVPSEPQGQVNFVYAERILGGGAFCGHNDVVKVHLSDGFSDSRISRLLYVASSPYAFGSVQSAAVPSWDRHPLRVYPNRIILLVSVNGHSTSAQIDVCSTHCRGTSWQLTPTVPWLAVSPMRGSDCMTADVSVTSTETMAEGDNWGWIVATSPNERTGEFKTILVQAEMVEHIHRAYMPIVDSSDDSR